LKTRGIEIHARSVFLQGLVFKKPEKLKGVLVGMRSKLEILGRIARDDNKSIMEIVLGFAMANKLVDRVVLGVDNIANLEEIIAAEKKGGLGDEVLNEMRVLIENNEDYILPFNWGKEIETVSKEGK
jgi:aryl-alcohol dehydrogenase-like predicted oxidoreductase